MPIQPYRTRSLRRIKVKTPKGRIAIHYKKRKPGLASCAICKQPLKGVPCSLPYQVKKLSKTERRPERPYGGYLCSSCMRKEILKKAPNAKSEKIEVGRLCLKLAGREAGKVCVITEMINEGFVVIDGQVKKRRCNINHLQTLDQKIKVLKSTTSEDIKKELKKLGYETKESKPKPKKEKQKKQRIVKKKEIKK